ncbi:MAG: hypothetical protein V2I43_13040 [Parvularcula sp.]|jgi:hypothetical protein|nr:hypothetical protein [Parvularcula sp.]
MTFRFMTSAACALLMAVLPAQSLASDKAELQSVRGARLVEMSAQPYIAFRQDVEIVSRAVPNSPEGLRDVHNRMASHDNKAVSSAFVAYAAMVAADTPAFSEEIQKRTGKKKDREAFLAELEKNPAMIRDLPGAEAAIAAIMSVSASDATRINKAGADYIKAAYSMQETAWARRKIAEHGMARVDEALAFAAKRSWPSMPGLAAKADRKGYVSPALASVPLWSASWSGEKAPIGSDAQAGSLITKALILGARYRLDEVEPAHLATYGNSRRSERCFSSAKMNLDQCIAATRTPFEEAFCLGQHALNEMSSCVGWPAGVEASAS